MKRDKYVNLILYSADDVCLKSVQDSLFGAALDDLHGSHTLLLLIFGKVAPGMPKGPLFDLPKCASLGKKITLLEKRLADLSYKVSL